MVTNFIVSFVRGTDIATLVTIPVSYACSWVDTAANMELIIEAAYAVAAQRVIDLTDHDAFMISHPHGDFRFSV